MATTDRDLLLFINSMSEEMMSSLKDSNGKIPSLANQLIMTDEEDVNLSQMRTKLLWTNPNPLNEFASKTLELDLTDYDYVMIYATLDNATKYDSRTKLTVIGKVGTTKNLIYGTRIQDVLRGFRTYNVTNSGIYFDSAYIIQTDNTSYTNNAWCTPTEIYGIKKTPAMIYTGAELHEGNGISINNGVVSASNIKVLWENPNPSSAFSPQTVTLNSNDYDFLMISMSMRTVGSTGNTWQTWIVRKNEDGFMFSDILSTIAAYNGQGIYRNFEARNETSIYFGDCYLRENNNVTAYLANQFNIPQKIYGIKVV